MVATGRPFLRRGPSGPLADRDLGDIQDGYDQVIEELFIPNTTGDFALFPRNQVGDPVRVVLPSVRPGNFLEVDMRFTLQAATGDQSYPTNLFFNAIAVVTFDGSDPTVPSATTFFIMDSWTGSFFNDLLGGEAPVADKRSMSSLCAVEIPDGATDATVEIIFLSDGVLIVNGGNVNTVGLGVTLKATEKGVNAVTQPGPGSLVPTT